MNEADSESYDLIDSAQNCIDHQNYSSAMIHLKKAEKLIPEMERNKEIYRIYQLIGWLNEVNGSNDLALQYFDKAMVYAKKTKDADFIVDVYINKANVYNNMNLSDSAYHINEEARRYYKQADASQQSTILKNMAYYEMIHNNLKKAEAHAYKAALLANDSSSSGNAMSLLCYIYLKENQDERAQMLMSFLPQGNSTLKFNQLQFKSEYLEKKGKYQEALQTYKHLKELSDSVDAVQSQQSLLKIQTQMDREILQREKMEQSLHFTVAIIILLLIIFILTIWYYRRIQTLYKNYQQRITNVREELHGVMNRKNARIEDMKKEFDQRMAEIDAMKSKLPTRLASDENYDSIAITKMGIDTLYAILDHQNISQMGKKEQKAVNHVLWNIDQEMAEVIDSEDMSLTPKETFFCIMERNGMDDRQKAESFCCTEQAVRSTKSRLSKKINLDILRKDNH